jgi:hypothetical protein
MQAIQRASSFILLIAAMIVVGCGSGRLTTRQAGAELQPQAALPEREQAQLPENLLIRIENVADDGGSYKNYATLRINGREIVPDKSISNFTSDYDFALRLPYGVYEIEGEYHVVGFWKEATYPIRADEPVKVIPGKKTLVSAKIEKDWRGFPSRKPLQFTLRYDDLRSEAIASISELKTSTTVETAVAPRESSEPVAVRQALRPAELDRPQLPEAAKPASRRQVVLQINTTPSNAEVIVDDRFCGNTPLRVTVSRDERHVVQVSRPGHADLLRVIDPQEVGEEKIVQLIFKLESTSITKE